MVGCVEGILGFRPDAHGLTLSPAVPSSWDSYTATKVFRGKTLEITFKNPAHKAGADDKSVITLNGEKLDGLYIPADKLLDVNVVEMVF
jgi:cellobiose phosphorylase